MSEALKLLFRALPAKRPFLHYRWKGEAAALTLNVPSVAVVVVLLALARGCHGPSL